MNKSMTQTADLFPLSTSKKIESICARFEKAWLSGSRPRIEQYLGRTKEPVRSRLFKELFLSEMEIRLQNGYAMNSPGYRDRFPEYAELIQQLLSESPPDSSGRPGDRDPGSPASAASTQECQAGAATQARRLNARELPAIPGYEVMKELGSGGMGVVYLARDRELNRLVALKLLLQEGKSETRHYARFRREAAVIARLKHPNIVQIYGVGKHKGRSFLVLEYVPGNSLSHSLRGNVVPAKKTAVFMEALAGAMHHAHTRGVIHRDLKPANILLSVPFQNAANASDLDVLSNPCTEPKVTDFGLAQDENALTGASDKTSSGVVLGTLSYIAPEQAQAKPATPATDIYALGIILYEMLTGHVPFVAESTIELLRFIVEHEPLSPRQLQPQCPRDLETICLKCLEKDPEKRYGSALELAEDLRRFHQGEAILARPVSSLERIVRWGRRNPLVSGLLAAVLLVLLVGTGISTFFAIQASHRAGEAERYAAQVESERFKATEAKESETAAHLRTAWALYGCRICWAQRELGAENLPKATMILTRCPRELRHWEHAYLSHLSADSTLGFGGHKKWVAKVAIARSGWLASVDTGNEIRLQNRNHYQPPPVLSCSDAILDLAFAENGNRLLCATDSGEVKGWQIPNLVLENAAPDLSFSVGTLTAAVFNPAGNRLAVAKANGTVSVYALNFHDGLRGPRSSLIWQGETGKVLGISMDRDGQRMALRKNGSVEIRDAGTGEIHRAIALESVHCAQISPNGQLLAVCRPDRTVALYDLSTGVRRHTLQGHNGSVLSLGFSSDSLRLATAGQDKTVKIWDLSHGQDLLTLMEPSHPVQTVAFSPDHQALLAGHGSIVQLWQVSRTSAR